MSASAGSSCRPRATGAPAGRLTDPAAIADLAGFLSDVETKSPQKNGYGCETSGLC
jgi:hypothetical protein